MLIMKAPHHGGSFSYCVLLEIFLETGPPKTA